MRKIFKIGFLSFLIFILFTNSSMIYANEINQDNEIGEKGDTILYSKKEIKEIKELEKQAKKDSLKNPDNISEGILTNEETGEKVKTKSYAYKQLLKVIEKPNGEKEEHYAITSFTEVPNIEQLENEKSNTEEVNLAGFGGFFQNFGNKLANNIYDKNNMNLALTSYDTSYSLKVWSTNYITKTSSQVYITRTTGGWSRLDSSVSITFTSFGAYQNGFAWDTGKYLTQNVNLTKSSSWDHNLSSRNWIKINPNKPHSVGITAGFSLKRGTSSSWTWSHVDRLVSEF